MAEIAVEEPEEPAHCGYGAPWIPPRASLLEENSR